MSDRDTIEKRRTEYVAAFNREDVVAMELYASDDTIGMAPNRPPIRGIEAHRVFWSEGFAAAKSLYFVFPEELMVAGDIAIDRHRWALDSMPRAGGRAVHDEGKGIWIWRRYGDGNWKVARAIWNSDLSRAGLWSSMGGELSEDLAAINRLLDLFVGAVNAGDANAWGEIMTDDFIFAVPDAPKFVGKEIALAAAKAAFFDPYILRLASKFDDVQIFGSQAFAQGVFTMERIPKAGGPSISGPGKFSNFFRKQDDGTWKYALVIFSYDQPTS